MPILKFKTKDEIPADFHDIVTEKDGAFEINVVSSAKLDQFRENNIAVSKERDDLKKWKGERESIFGEATLDDFNKELTELRGTAQKVKDGTLTAKGDIEAEVTKRTETMRGTLEAQIAAKAGEAKSWKEKAEASESKLRMTIVDNAINSLAIDKKFGLNPKALPDVLARARGLFEVQADGSLVPKRNGEILRGEDGTSPMTPSEWLVNLRKEAEYYFLGSNGGGATGDQGAGKANLGGYTEKDFNALSPIERLKIANRQGAK